MIALVAVLLTTIGALALWYGEGDDSPGLQGIGALLVLAAAALMVRALRRRRSTTA